MQIKPWSLDLRAWQERAYRRYERHTGPDFLAVATPGAGKTLLALRIAHSLLWTGAIARVVVVCPTDHLRGQWSEAAARVGIHLDSKWKNDQGTEAQDFHGVTVTYQQVAMNPDIHRLNCRQRTLVIFDEVHHAGDGNAWGDKLRYAFERAPYRLLISGTPFRSDNNPMPFVTYEDNRSKADFVYGYGDALADNVCRPILFPSYEGEMTWFSGGDVLKASFKDELSQSQESERLRTALDPAGDWMRTVIKEANEKLSAIRGNGHPDAGGLVITSDQYHARRVAELIQRLTGEVAIVAISDDPDASANIVRFSSGTTRWLVAVRMVSEGVDIPRLRVGVYATTYRTEMYFRQAVGRFVRMICDSHGTPTPDEQAAYLYIPSEPVLIEFAQQIKDERDHALTEAIEKLDRDVNEAKQAKQEPLYAAISSTTQPDAVIFDEVPVSQAEIDRVRAVATRYGIQPEIFARAQRDLDHTIRTDEPRPAPQTQEIPLRQQKDQAKRTIKYLVRQAIEAGNGAFDYQYVYGRLMATDNMKQEQATLDQLMKRIEYLNGWIKELRRGY